MLSYLPPCINTHPHFYTHTHTNTHTNTHTCTYTHTHAHTHTRCHYQVTLPLMFVRVYVCSVFVSMCVVCPCLCLDIMRVHTHILTHVLLSMSLYKYHACTHTLFHTCRWGYICGVHYAYICTHSHTHEWHPYADVNFYVSTHAHARAHKAHIAYQYDTPDVFLYTWIYINVYIYINLNMYIRMYMHVHTYICMYMYIRHE